MRTMLFVLAALSAVGLADASQVIVLGNEPEEARPTEPELFVIVDPVCAFDGSGCLPVTATALKPVMGATPEAAQPYGVTPEAQYAEPAPAATQSAVEPEPAQEATQSGEEPSPATQSGEEPTPATQSGEEPRPATAEGQEGP